MKRDMDLIRKILFAIESCDNPWGPGSDFEIDGYPRPVVSYHVKILAQAGLLEADEAESMGIGAEGFQWYPSSLTWAGHEFLDAARDDTRWAKAKRLVTEKAGGLMFEAVKFTLTQGVMSQLRPVA